MPASRRRSKSRKSGSRAKRRSKSGSRKADSKVKVKEYSMKVFAPLKYSIDESALDAIFPGVSFGMRKVIKNGKLVGYNYILGSTNEDIFTNLMLKYRTFIK
jgi:hypothetical protein